MEQKQLEELKDWFFGYIKSFYNDDPYINANLARKERHTKRICEEMLNLAKGLNLNPEKTRLAEAIALLHDTGRFPQFVKYRTYNDSKSINHCLLGIEELQRTKALAKFDTKEQEIILQAIKWHGEKDVPADLKGDCLLFTKMVRDADKVDIFFSVTNFYTEYAKDPKKVEMLEIEVPDTPEYTQSIIEQLLRQEKVDYRDLNTWNDMKLLQLAWIYDINFEAALKRIKEKNYIETILEYLPRDEQIAKVKAKVLGYIEQRIGKS